MTSPLLLEHFDELISTPDDVDKLNNSILELAIRGKLVEQDSNDEPVSNLFAKIQEVKGKDFKFSKTIKEDDKPFDLPHGWEWIRFGELTINRDGERIPLSKEVRETRKGKYDYYGASGVIDHIDGYLFDKPLLLIGEDGANLINRSTPIAFIAEGQYWVNNHAHVLDAIDFGILKYLEVFINAIDLKPYITGTAQPKMNQAKMNSIVVALPPLAEQKRIVARVEELFAQTRRLAEELSHSRTELDRLNESALARLLASETQEEFNERWGFIAEHFDLLTSAPEHIAPLRQSILELAVRGKLTRREAGDESAKELLKRIHANIDNIVEDGKKRKIDVMPLVKDNEKSFDLPEGWAWARVGDIAYGYRGHNPVKDKFIYEPQDGYVRFVQITDFKTEDRAVYVPISPQNKMIYKGEIIMAAYRHIGKLSREMEGAFNVALCKVMELPPMSRDYLERIIGTSFVKGELLKASGRAHIPSMHLGHFLSLPIPLPPLAEQERIVKRMEQLLGWCDALEAQLMSAEDVRGRLVESVLAGGGG